MRHVLFGLSLISFVLPDSNKLLHVRSLREATLSGGYKLSQSLSDINPHFSDAIAKTKQNIVPEGNLKPRRIN